MNKTEDQSHSSTSQTETRPECFGDPEQVCPKSEEGFIQPQANCLSCQWIKSCLQAALRKEGVIPRTAVEKLKDSKVGSFLKRWSDQKSGTGKPPSKK